MEELFRIVSRIPEGRVASYGDLGRSLVNPVSGLVAGHWMEHCPPDLPWWRVVGKDGRLLIARRDAAAALVQRELLESEGVSFQEGRVDVQAHLIDPAELLDQA